MDYRKLNGHIESFLEEIQYVTDIKKEQKSRNFGKPSKRYEIDDDVISFYFGDDGYLSFSGELVDGIPDKCKDLKTAVNDAIDNLNKYDREMYAGCRWHYIPVFDGETEAELEVELLGYPI